MKITEEFLKDCTIDDKPAFTTEEIHQILKNQEDAEKYRKIIRQGTLPLIEVVNALEIVEKIKKRIEYFEFLGKQPMSETASTQIDYESIELRKKELQKLLDVTQDSNKNKLETS